MAAVAADEKFQAGLIAREAEFWGYVERDEPPPQGGGGGGQKTELLGLRSEPKRL